MNAVGFPPKVLNRGFVNHASMIEHHHSVSDACRQTQVLLDEVQAEINRLDDTPAAELETTLIAIPQMLSRFDAYLAFLDQVDALLRRQGRVGVYQVASFHPRYRFDGLPPDDPSHLNNRSPLPLIHLLREDGVAAAVARHPAAHGIPEVNIQHMRALSAEQRRALFGSRVDD